jgi:hypothetical protein
LPCVEYYIQQLIDTCGSNGRVGGYVHVNNSGNYVNVEVT